MSDSKTPANSLQERGGKEESNLKKGVSPEEDKMTSKSNLDGNNKEVLPSSTPDNSLEEALDQNLTEFGSGDAEISNLEIEVEDADNVETNHSWGDLDDSMDSLTNQDLDAIKMSSSDEMKKPGLSFLEPGVSLAGDDFDSENQDDELVLKWEDDDEEEVADLGIEGDQIDFETTNNDGSTEEIDSETVTVENDEPTVKQDNSVNPRDSFPSQSDDTEDRTDKSPQKHITDTLNDTNFVDSNNKRPEASVKDFESETHATVESNENTTAVDSAAKNVDSEAIIDAISDIIEQGNDKQENNVTIKTALSQLEHKESVDVHKSSKTLHSKDDRQNILKVNKSNETVDESEENKELLSEIDAHIAELDASMSKNENDKKPTKKSDVNTEKANENDHEIKSVDDISMKTGFKDMKKDEGDAVAGAFDEKTVSQKIVSNLESKIPTDEKSPVPETSIPIENDSIDGFCKVSKDQTLINTDPHTVTDINKIVDENCDVQMPDTTSVLDTKELSASSLEDSSKITKSLANSTTTTTTNIKSETAEHNDSLSPNTSTAIELTKHGLNEPNMMLEIPTQELIDLDDSLNLTDDEKNLSADKKKDDVLNSTQHESMSIDNVDKGSHEDGNIIETIHENLKTSNKQSNASDEPTIILPATSIQDDVEIPKIKDEKNPSEVHSIEVENKTTKELAVCIEGSIEQPTDIEQETENKTSEEQHLDHDTEKNSIVKVVPSKTDQLTKADVTEKTGFEISTTVDDTTLEHHLDQDTAKDSIVEAVTCKTDRLSKDVSSKTGLEISTTVDDTTLEQHLDQNTEKDSLDVTSKIDQLSKDDVTEKAGPEISTTIEDTTLSVVEKPTSLQDVTSSDSVESSKDIADDKQDENIGIVSQTTERDVQLSTTKDLPSTSTQMAPDSSDDDTAVTDSLGLLAECSRVAEDDDDQDPSDHDDDDDDFDGSPDESSNQPDQSEDSVQNSETDLPKLIASTSGMSDKDGDNAQGFQKTLQLTPHLFDSLLANKDQGYEEETAALPSEGPGEDAPDDPDMDVDDDIVCEEVVVTPSKKVIAPATLIGDADPDLDEALDATLGEPDIVGDSDIVGEPDIVGDTDVVEGTDIAEVPVIEAVESIDVDKPIETVVTTTEQATQPEVPQVKRSTIDDAEESTQSNLSALAEDKSAETPIEKDSKVAEASKDKASEGAIVDLGEISSEEDVPEVKNDQSVDGDVIKPASKTTARINTSEISIKTTTSPKPPMVIPEVAKVKDTKTQVKPKFPLEVFNLDSDEEDTPAAVPAEPPKPTDKCINNLCQSDASATYVPADSSSRMYYQCKKRGYICLRCLEPVHNTTEKLIAGIKNYTPLLQLELRERDFECVEILDSDSEDETDTVPHADREKIQEPAVLERQLAAIINATWDKYQFERLLTDAQDQLVKEMERIETESKEINEMLDECQSATDKLRDGLYSTFTVPVEEQPAITIYDMPDKQFTCLEAQSEVIKDISNKRRLSDATESKAKRPSMSAEGDNTESPKHADNKQDDDKDVSVVRLSAEAAPPSLPPAGEPLRPPLTPGLPVYAMRHAFGSWIKARVLDVTPKGQTAISQNFTMCRVKFENKTNRNATKVLPARCLAYCGPSDVRMTIGTRVIALFKALSPDEKEPKRESYYSGVIAEIPNPVNKYRYLVFFDDGYAQYVTHADTRLVCEFSPLVWEEVHSFSREFVKEYLLAYPERPMVRLHTGQHLKTEWNGKWWASRVIAVDASLVQVYFEQDKRTEWIYRGSTRLAPLYLELQAAEKHSRARPLPRNRQNKLNMPYVEYIRTDEADTEKPAQNEEDNISAFKAQQEAEIRRQRAVAKKSTAGAGPVPPPAPAPAVPDTVTSRVVYYTPKNAIKPHKMAPHSCGPRCKRTDVLSLKELRTYNPLAKPLLSGWERQTARFKGHKEVAYRAPCGRRIRNMKELHRYLRLINSDMGVDLFDFGPNTHCLAEFVLNKCIVGKKDLSHGKENVPVPCVNYYDDSLPEFCSYNTERTPTAGVPLNTDPDFLCGCDCTDDCEDKSKCACWKLTLEGARTIGLDGDVGYEYKRLPEPLPSGIYECNSRCKCKSTCLNRVAQHPLQLKLQVFKTANRGWGIRALNDVPKGSFLCIYAGNLLTDATANLDGLNEGDEYLAELDYIEVVEQMKEGYEEDIPDADKQLDKKESAQQSDQESTETEEEEETHSKSDEADGDFQPAFIPGVVAEFSKRLRKRDKKKKKEEKEGEKEREKDKGENAEDDCITISDDEEIREPSRFAAQAGMGGEYVSKHRSVRSYFGKDEACYIMDAKVQGNIGRYLNHSCSPNVFVQNVFVDTHDPRFPWVAFFALSHIRAGTELTWNYNYDVGSVPGKALYCYCGAPNCRGRLL